MMIGRKLLCKPVQLYKVMKVFRNWPTFLLARYCIGKGLTVIKLRNGTKFKVRKNFTDVWVLKEIFVEKPYHRYLGRLKEDSVVIDIGANIGAFSILTATQGKSVRIYSYEPFKANFKLLEENVRLNALKDRIKVFNCGVADSSGERSIFGGSNTLRCNMYRNEGTEFCEKGEGEKIKVVSLGGIFSDNNIKTCQYLKVDAEGAEYEIFYSASNAILDRIETIALEYHQELGTGNGMELKTFLEKKDFCVDIYQGQTMGYIYAEKSH